MMRRTGPPMDIVESVLVRDGYACVKCGLDVRHRVRGLSWSIHHRRRRDRRPDSNQPQNLVVLCGADNVSGCHGWAHQRRSESQPEGYWLSRVAGEDPLRVPVLLRGERWVYLTPAGTYSDHPPEERESTDG